MLAGAYWGSGRGGSLVSPGPGTFRTPAVLSWLDLKRLNAHACMLHLKTLAVRLLEVFKI